MLAIAPASGDDWPGWRGPRRDSLCKETGLLKSWPAEGPPLRWKAKGLGEGLSGPAIVGNRLYTMGNSDGKERVLALDLSQDGKQIWSSAIGDVRHAGGGYPGPRATPTIDGTRLYALGINGDLVCMDTQDGRILWSRDSVKDFGGKIHDQGYSESPLVDGSWVICTPGMKDATMVALDKMTGNLVWAASVGDQAAHASAVKFTAGGVEQYVTITGKGVIAVRARDGKFLWRNDHPAINCMTVVTSGETVFVTNEHGGGTVSIVQTTDGFQAKELYFTKSMKNYHGGVVLVDGMLYGSSNNLLTCLEYRTGEVRWSDRGPGKCSVLYADGCLYCRDEGGTISLVEAAPNAFHLKGQFKQPDRSHRQAWPHLVIADRRLYVRDQDVLLCYDVAEPKR
jgi:outer membrane protein assembly factor BamB